MLGPDDTRSNHGGLTTDITIGYGLSPQLIVFAMSRIVWFQLEGELTFSEVAGVGASYFFSERAPSLYVTGGLGYAIFVQPGSDTENQFGVGALASRSSGISGPRCPGGVVERRPSHW